MFFKWKHNMQKEGYGQSADVRWSIKHLLHKLFSGQQWRIGCTKKFPGINAPLGKLTITVVALKVAWCLQCNIFASLKCNRFVLTRNWCKSILALSDCNQCWAIFYHVEKNNNHVNTCSSPLLGFSKVHVNMVSFSSQSSSWGGHQAARAGPHQTQRWQHTDGEVLVFTRTRTSRDHPASALSSHLTNTLYRRRSSLSASFNS